MKLTITTGNLTRAEAGEILDLLSSARSTVTVQVWADEPRERSLEERVNIAFDEVEAKSPFSREGRLVVKGVRCPFCDKDAGWNCTTPKGDEAQFVHVGRIRDYVNSLS